MWRIVQILSYLFDYHNRKTDHYNRMRDAYKSWFSVNICRFNYMEALCNTSSYHDKELMH
jgi:hypothetical protein